MLILPIKKKWYDMILSGKKKEEYREIKPYYRSRLIHEGFLDVYGLPQTYVGRVMFRNGYSHNSPSFVALCSVDIRTGRSEWGAEPGREYYVLTICDFLYKWIENEADDFLDITYTCPVCHKVSDDDYPNCPYCNQKLYDSSSAFENPRSSKDDLGVEK